tara:strand:- start:2165 stop:3769 length:1605 start_codon:yes stop_codon:yes gene_type:complete
MLKKINIKNLAIIDELEIELNPSFNVLTGESGSGKTIIYKSINYLFGEPFNKENIRKGESCCEISGLVSINSKSYQIRRVFTNTKTINYIDGKIFSRKKYLDFIEGNWESYGQHEQHLLLDSNNHIIYIDLFADNKSLLINYRTLFDQYKILNNEIEKIVADGEDYSRNKELYEYQLKELKSFSIDINEDEVLKEQIKEIEENEEIANYLRNLSTIDSSSNILGLFAKTSNKLKSTPNKSENINNMIDRLNDLHHEFSDLEYEAAKLLKNYDYDHNELRELQDKLLKINNLKRKYGGTIESVLIYKRELDNKIANSENVGVILKDKLSKKVEIEKDLLSQAKFLLIKRLEAARELEENIKNDLKSMQMDDVEFSVKLGDIAINQNAIEECVFNIQTNKGESIKSIGDIVSGGELSRIMMAIKLSINISSNNKIFILDEIDAGLSGKEADSIGSIIERLSKKNQVLCITHLSQIASKAKEHFRVSKKVVNKRTVCCTRVLNRAEKIKELAVMISGDNITSKSIDYAEQMLGQKNG